MTSHLALRSTDVVHETLEGETIIIDLQSGAYYSVAGLSSALFLKAVTGATKSELIAWVTETYPDVEAAAPDTATFLDTLVSSGLCVVVDAPADDAASVEPPTPPVDYTAPVIEGYEDMAELLLLDPIHEVDPEAGWPSAPADA